MANIKAGKPFVDIITKRVEGMDDPKTRIVSKDKVVDTNALASFPNADFFLLKDGKLEGVTIKSESQIANFMNELEGLKPERIDEKKRKEIFDIVSSVKKGNKFVYKKPYEKFSHTIGQTRIMMDEEKEKTKECRKNETKKSQRL